MRDCITITGISDMECLYFINDVIIKHDILLCDISHHMKTINLYNIKTSGYIENNNRYLEWLKDSYGNLSKIRIGVINSSKDVIKLC